MKILNRIYIVLAILFAIAGIVQSVRWISLGPFTIIVHLLNFIPMLAFFLAYDAGRKNPRKATHIVAIPLCLVALFLWAGVTAGGEMIITATTEVADVEEYEEILDVK